MSKSCALLAPYDLVGLMLRRRDSAKGVDGVYPSDKPPLVYGSMNKPVDKFREIDGGGKPWLVCALDREWCDGGTMEVSAMASSVAKRSVPEFNLNAARGSGCPTEYD